MARSQRADEIPQPPAAPDVDSHEERLDRVRRALQFDRDEEEDTEDPDSGSVAGSTSHEDTVSVVEDPVDVAAPRAPALRAAFRNMDGVDVERIFSLRASVMRSVPHFLQGPFRNVMKMVLEEIMASVEDVRVTRAWKVFSMLPRMLLHRPPGGGTISREKLVARFEDFSRGEWGRLIEASRACDEKAARSRRRAGRRRQDELELRAARAERLVQVGELSSARQALDGAALAPCNQTTLRLLTDASRRPPRPREPLPPEVLNHMPQIAFQLDEDVFNKNLRSSKKGAAAGPSGMTCEHLRPLLPDHRGLHLLFQIAERMAKAQVPEAVVNFIRMGRLTALSKPDGGVRGIVVGDVLRRLVARTMSQQLAPAVERATSPYQYALTTRAGCECVAHALQGLTEMDPQVTVTSIDGLGAFDLISRGAMLRGLMRVSGAAVPFTRMFYGRSSEYLWESDSGEVHRIPQGEGGEQGDPMMPLLYSLGQHGALEAASNHFSRGERLFAFLDDTYIVTPTAAEVGGAYTHVQNELWNQCGIRIHVGKTKIWNRAGVRPEVSHVLERIAQRDNPRAKVWRGSEIPTEEQGMKVLGTPLGHEAFVARHLQAVADEHRVLLDRIPRVRDVQSAWLLLLHCASARSNYQLRSVPPDASAEFAAIHDAGLWRCLCSILQLDPAQADTVQETATVPLSLGGFGPPQRCENARASILGKLG